MDETWGKVQFRCKICPDAIGEQGDLVTTDVWPGGAPKGEGESFSSVIARTPRGLALLEEAIEAGVLTLVEELDFRAFDDYQPHQLAKKQGVADRLRAMADAGVPVPQFAGLRLAENAACVSDEVRGGNYRGMRTRLERGANLEPAAAPRDD